MIDFEFFNRIEEHWNNRLPCVIYRKPNTNQVSALLQNDDVLNKIVDYTDSGFIFSPFDDKEATIIIPLDKSERINIPNYKSSIKVVKKERESSVEAEKQQHINLVQNGVYAIKNKRFKKVVLSRQESISFENSNPIAIFKKMLNTYKSAFVYCWFHPKVGLWLGATPETLIKIEGNRFSIMALAGTQNYNGSLDVTWEEKEKQEQQFVTDFIVDNLNDFVKHLEVSETKTVKAGNLLHLKTMISARLNSGYNLKALISALHPTPAVCGLPKQAAKEFILKEEHYNRAYYTGYLGELNFETHRPPRTSKRNIENRAYTIIKKQTQLYVNLRCMQLVGNKALIYVGGGITETSNPEKEWQETVSKSHVIKSIL